MIFTIFLSLQDHKVAISGEDFILNDVNSPYTIKEIYDIANVRAFIGDVEITNKLIVDFDDYENNKANEGNYNVIYKAIYNNEEYLYKLIIINKNLTTIESLDELYFEVNLGEYFPDEKLFKMIEEELEKELIDPIVVESNFDSNEIGLYYSLVEFKNDDYQYELLVRIDVIDNNKSKVYILIGVGLLLVFITFIVYKLSLPNVNLFFKRLQ